MEYINEVWRTDLYKLQQQAPKAKLVPCKIDISFKPPSYGLEYHGNISREDVEKVMRGQASGAYLIRDGLRSPGTYTLVIKFDEALKNYKLFYDPSTHQHYVGYKYFDKISDLVQDGLIHLYIESRGAAELRKIAESNIYEDSPFYKTRYYTLQMTKLKPTNQKQNQSKLETRVSGLKNTGDIQSQSSKNKDNYSTGTSGHLDSSLGRPNPFYTNNPFLNSGDSYEHSETNICPPIRHSSLISSQLARQRIVQTFNKNYSDDESVSIQCQNSDLFGDRQIDTSSSSSSMDTRLETKNSAEESGFTVSTTDTTNSLSSETSLDNQLSLEIKSDQSVITSKSVASQYTSFADQEKSHNFKTHSFKGPHWCDFCTHFMWGLVAQGVKCQDCGFQAHRKCSDRVPADCLPDMKRLKRVFGVELTSLGKVENRGVPLVLVKLITLVENKGLDTEGLYRVSGNTELIEELKVELDKDIDSVDMETDCRLSEIHNVTSLVKLFFRQLPIPLVTLEVSSLLMDILKSNEAHKQRLEQCRDCLLRLPLVHYVTLKFLITHLHKIAVLSDLNKMTVENLAIVFAPSLISHQPIPVLPGSGNLSAIEMQELIHKTLQSNVDIVEDLIRHNDYLFVDERQLN